MSEEVDHLKVALGQVSAVRHIVGATAGEQGDEQCESDTHRPGVYVTLGA